MGRATLRASLVIVAFAAALGCGRRMPVGDFLAAWEATAGGMTEAREGRALALLGDGRVLACGGTADGATPLESCEAYDPWAGSWRPTAPMAEARLEATATTLTDGRVLVCGGDTAACEVYTPADDTWTDAPAMAAPRRGATATLLRSGLVLVAGGDATGSAEIFDPATAGWSSAGAIAPRRGATAVLLGDGRVLVVGGMDSGGPVADVDLYDPASNTWSAGAALPEPRADHTATRLRTGQVLVVGGTDGAAVLGDALLFDESTGSWDWSGALAEPRRRHAAALLPSGRVLVLGGTSGTEPLSSVEVYDPATGGFKPSAPLTEAREGPSAALLASGDVLVTGGRNGAPVTSSERYTPTADTSPVPPMAHGRTEHTATVLRSGEVLVVGGFDDDLGGAEIYDPHANAWRSAGALAEPRGEHTATLLPDGRVLIAGGTQLRGSTSSTAGVEIYDPATGAWAPAAPMAEARHAHTATLLMDGRVLVAGGVGSSGALASAELYDPRADTWTAAAPMAAARSALTATLLPSGRVLVAIGDSAELYDPELDAWTPAAAPAPFSGTATLLPSGKVLATGRWQGTARVQTYDPVTDSWSAVAPTIYPHLGHTATLLPSGRVLIAGSAVDAGAGLELYDPVADTWDVAGNMETPRAYFTAALLDDGGVLLAGGMDWTTGHIASAELWDLGEAARGPAVPMAAARYDHTATLLPSGKVLVIGGVANTEQGETVVGSAELYDPATDAWSAAGALAEARQRHTVTLLRSGKVLVVGGTRFAGDTEVMLASAELFDPAARSFSAAGTLAQARAWHTATLLPSGDVLVAGGSFFDAGGAVALASTEIYDPETNAWREGPSLSAPRASHSATLLPSGKVLVVGGPGWVSCDSGGPAPSADLYDPATDTFGPAAPPLDKHWDHRAVLLPNGSVLVAGPRVCTTAAELYDPITNRWAVVESPNLGTRVGATLLATGKVFFAGEHSPPCELPVFVPARLFDPGIGTFRPAGLAAPPEATATLLPSGDILVAGGVGSIDPVTALATASLLDLGLGFQPAWRPVVEAPASLRAGALVTLRGARFRGPVQAAGGTAASAAVDLPVVGLVPLTGGLPRFLAPSRFDDGSLDVTVPAEHGFGYDLLTVFVAGVPSESVIVKIGTGSAGEPCAAENECTSGFCAGGVCCDTACDDPCLACTAALKGGGHDGTCGPSASPECTPADAGVLDGSAPDDADVPAGDAGAASPAGGCGCRSAARAAGGSAAFAPLVLLGGLLAARRSRGSRRRA